MTIFIASIDPGVTTGLVIATANAGVELIRVEYKIADDFTDIRSIFEHLTKTPCRNVLMEQKPRNASPEGTTTWNSLFSFLTDSQDRKVLTTGDINDYKTPVMFLIQPSSWKPFMKPRKSKLPSGLPHHAKDAACMLHYKLSINYQHKEIYYVT